MDDEIIEFHLHEIEFQSNKTKLQSALDILKRLAVPSVYFETNQSTRIFSYFYSFTNNNFGRSDVLEICDFFLQNDFHLILIKLTEFYLTICESLQKNHVSDVENRKISIFEYSQYVLNFLLAYSINFRIKFFENGGLKNLLSLVNNDIFMQTFYGRRYIEFILMNINQLSKDADLYRSEWIELQAVDIFLKVAENNPYCKIHCYSGLSNIATDHQINTILKIQEIIPIFVKQINKGAQEINKSPNLEREKIQFNEEDEAISQQYDVYHVPDDDDVNLQRSLTGLINTIYRLAVNDKIKYDLFVKHNVKDSLRILVFKGVEIEKKYALKLLAQLCFDAQVIDMVSKDVELVQYIEKLSNNSDCVIKSLPKVCKQVLWSLKMKNYTSKEDAVKGSTSQKSQIMISYNGASRDLCINLKDELEKAGYKVWIDIDEIHGSSLDSMARAVETSEIILMCVTEKYRQSINCQAEAQYAFKLKKPILPLIMQKGYENVDGWLGMIMGDRIYINFMKYNFVEAIKRLLAQVSLLKPPNQPMNSPPKPPASIIQTEIVNENISTWDEAKVEKWFNDNGNSAIYQKLKPCDGELLVQLHKMYLHAPEFFYQSLSNDKVYDLRQTLVFTKQFEKLFN
jgi:hypothetical protein